METLENKVAIIIVNWNSYNDTIECLKSLNDIKEVNFKVFLVDNNSTDKSMDEIISYYDNYSFNYDIEFICNKENLGFAGGNNVGIRKAYNDNCKFFWLLNNDTVVDEKALVNLINTFKNEDIGIVGSKILYYDSNKIWFAGGLINEYIGRTSHIGIKEDDLGQYDYQKEVDYISGCSLCFTREMLDKVGYMLEDYFLYFEETDWNLRAKKCGFKIIYVPDSIVYHKVSYSSGGMNNIKPYVPYYELRNSIAMIKRTQNNTRFLLTIVYAVFLLLKIHAKIFIRYRNNYRVRSKYAFKGIIDGIKLKMGKHPELI